MSRELPARPNLEHLRNQARTLLRDLQRGDDTARARFAAVIRPGREPKLSDALHVIAREHGFDTWPLLKSHVEQVAGGLPALAAALAAALDAGNAERLRSLLAVHPELREELDRPIAGDAFGTTPLVRAARRGNAEIVDVLLDAGADVDVRTEWWAGGFGVLDSCAPDLAPRLLERGAHIDAHAASRLGLRDELAQIIRSDPSVVHARGGDGMTPLHFAADTDIADMLLAAGADIDAIDVDHESTPAQYMVGDRVAVARHLVARGCRTDVLMAVAIGDIDLVAAHLRANPASIRTRASDQWFPKRDARAGGTIYIWTVGQNASPHAIARKRGYEDVLDLLMENSPPELAFTESLDAGDAVRSAAVAAAHPGVGSRAAAADPARLVDAARRGDTRAALLLLEAGWPANARENGDSTALHWAAMHGNVGLVTELLRRGADAGAQDTQFGATPLVWCDHGEHNSWLRDGGDYGKARAALLAASQASG